MDLENYYVEMAEHEEQTKAYLEAFGKYLKADYLSPKTITVHLSNMEFYLNVYLTSDVIYTAERGARRAYDFFTWFLPRKVINASDFMIKSYGASLRKFYKMLYEQGKISKDDFDRLKDDVKKYKDIPISELRLKALEECDELLG